jgi:hypothetical protein
MNSIYILFGTFCCNPGFETGNITQTQSGGRGKVLAAALS